MDGEIFQICSYIVNVFYHILNGLVYIFFLLAQKGDPVEMTHFRDGEL